MLEDSGYGPAGVIGDSWEDARWKGRIGVMDQSSIRCLGFDKGRLGEKRSFRRACWGLVVWAGGMMAASAGEVPHGVAESRVRQVLQSVPLIDGHNDTPWAYRDRVRNHLDQIDFAGDTADIPWPMHTDIPRLRMGGVGGQFWSVYTPVSTAGPGAARVVFEQIDVVHRLVERYPEHLQLALTAQDIVEIHQRGKVASLIGMEGGHCIENSLGVLRQLYRAGARYMTITHSKNTDWADASTDDPHCQGLSAFGKEVIREMNRMGMLVDISHVSAKTMHDTLDVAEAPVIFSHSSARAVCDHVRNVPDDVLERIKKAPRGVVMVTFVPPFVSEKVRSYSVERSAERDRLTELHGKGSPELEEGMAAWQAQHPAPRATLSEVADHIDHIRDVAGIDCVGIGGDFDGIREGPEGLEDVSKYPDLLIELVQRGYSDEDLRKLCGDNVLRVMREAEAVALRLQAERPASGALFDELDGERAEAAGG